MSFGRDYIHSNVRFPCHLNHVVKNQGHDAVEAGLHGTLLEMGKKPGASAWVIP
jgi:hypothetical protein